MQLTLEVLRRFAGRQAHADILQAIVDAAPAVLPKYGITSPARVCQFFANIAVETGGFTTIREENMNYTTAARLRQVWKSRFGNKSDAELAPLLRNPERLGNTVYANRMGNGPPSSGDGFRYRGRSLPQLTGREAYEAIGRMLGLPLLTNPHLVCELPHILAVAAAFWKWKGPALARAADAGQTRQVRKLWNGGTVGLEEVISWVARAEKVFTSALEFARPAALLEVPGDADIDAANDDDAAEPVAAPATSRVVFTDAETAAAALSDADIEAVQRRLKALKYHELGMIDGKWGGRLAAAIAAFKNDRHLSGEPVIDDALKAELDAAEAEGWTRPIAPERAEGKPEGSRVLDAAEKQGTAGGVLAGGGILTWLATKFSEWSDTVRELLEPLRPMFRPIGHFIVDHWPLVLVAGGGFVAWQASRAWRARVEDHREGKTT